MNNSSFRCYDKDMKILVVEDNVKLAQNLKQGLTQEGYAVDIIVDGLVAENRILINRDEYDLVVLDRMLPGKDGVSVCASWRESGVVIPVLMLTALDTTDDKVVGLDAGADDYLAKPFVFKELLARVHALLRRPKQSLPDILKTRDISINTTSRVVEYKNKPISLTLKEFMVLEYLMRNVNKVVTRDELYSHAWDFVDSSFSNTVDVHIKNLRKKLHDNSKIIQTIRGVGYKMQN
ncbi:MAG: response regulator transcription factor [Candidatus Pacebacteria bacterium]|nr:response regulator transcription factor [Candidatus Paceibacterota bacterium]